MQYIQLDWGSLLWYFTNKPTDRPNCSRATLHCTDLACTEGSLLHRTWQSCTVLHWTKIFSAVHWIVLCRGLNNAHGAQWHCKEVGTSGLQNGAHCVQCTKHMVHNGQWPMQRKEVGSKDPRSLWPIGRHTIVGKKTHNSGQFIGAISKCTLYDPQSILFSKKFQHPAPYMYNLYSLAVRNIL